MNQTITLFPSNATEFTTNGLGSLSDSISCIVEEELNGSFELKMEYPITGRRFNDLVSRRIIVCKSNPFSNRQAFRIYKIGKPLKGIVTISAEHCSYDMTGYPVEPFTAESVAPAFVSLKDNSILVHPYTFWTNKTNAATLAISKPVSTRSVLSTILELYSGEYEFDMYSVKLHEQRGTNRGFSIRYGKNLTDLNQEENCSTVYTAVYPYWFQEKEDEPDVLVQLPERYLLAPGTYDFAKIFPLDLSSEFEEEPTEEELRIKATYYMQINGIGLPRVSLSVSFVLLAQSEEYKNLALLETVLLGDTVSVEFPKMNVSSSARCVKTTYNVKTDKYDKIELGHAFSNIASTISEQNKSINNVVNKVPSRSYVQAAVENATKLITGGLGGHVVLHSSSGGSYPDEILIMDTEDITTATKVWRWNTGGLGYSGTGYSGQYALAMTMDGAIVAGMITSGKIQADQIEAGSITANELSLTYKGAVSDEIVGKISTFEDGLSLSVTNSGTVSWIALTSNGINIMSPIDIRFSGAVTFEDLSESNPAITIINGDNITTGKIRANLIATNNNGYIEFLDPIITPEVAGINNIYFGTSNLITDQAAGYTDYLTLKAYYGVRIPEQSGLYVKKIRNDDNLSIDAYNNEVGKTIYIGTKTASDAPYSYAINQTIQIGKSDANGSSTTRVTGDFYHGSYIVLDSNNINNYVVFQ